MWESLDKPLAIFILIAIPLAWGVGVEYIFELLRRRRGASQDESESPSAYE